MPTNRASGRAAPLELAGRRIPRFTFSSTTQSSRTTGPVRAFSAACSGSDGPYQADVMSVEATRELVVTLAPLS